jgi:hypothetical protein
VAPLSSPYPVATSTHHRSARCRPAWLFFFLLLPSPYSPRPCRVAGLPAVVLAKLSPCAASVPSMWVCLEPPRFSSIRAPPRYQRRALPRLHARRSVAPTPDAAPLACPSPAPALALQRAACRLLPHVPPRAQHLPPHPFRRCRASAPSRTTSRLTRHPSCSCSGRATRARATNRASSALRIREPSCLR